MSKTGCYKDPNSIEQRLKRLGYEPVQSSTKNYRKEADRSRVLASYNVPPLTGKYYRGKQMQRKTKYSLLDKDGTVIRETATQAELVDWLEGQGRVLTPYEVENDARVHKN
jgi:hypothetical protein